MIRIEEQNEVIQTLGIICESHPTPTTPDIYPFYFPIPPSLLHHILTFLTPYPLTNQLPN
jgi:hypothetical protein